MPAKGMVLGAAVDLLVGDPRRGHPVAGFGRAAASLERRVYKDSRLRGALYAGALVAAAAGTGVVIERAGGRRAWVTAIATWVVLGGGSLGREGERMAEFLEDGDLKGARDRLPHLCGRDPAGLDAGGLARATVESVAENTSDAVVAPLFWGAVAGVPGLLAYRAVNTLDAMVGYRSPRYRNFGWAAARLDDAANWVPARLTGLLVVACARKDDRKQAFRTLRRDGAAHPSPNAGRCEAAFAGALGVRLGGTNVYEGRTEARPEMGDGRPVEVADIKRAVRLSRRVTIASAALAAAAAGVIRRG